ncbi:MAG: hypothetical protein Q4B52_04175 [Tissierellia bacterium]|nr:hypothetical protein [Tissierellia bacterium]
MFEENRDYKSNDILKIVNGFHPILLKFYFLIALIIAFLEIAVLSYSNALFIDTANSIFKNELSKSAIFKPLILLIVTLFLINAMINLPDIFESKFKYSLETNLLPQLIKLRAGLEYEYIEDQKSLELIKLITDEMTETFMDYLMTVNEIVKCIIAIISASFIILLKAFWILPVLIVISFPILLFSNKMGKKELQCKKEGKKIRKILFLFF